MLYEVVLGGELAVPYSRNPLHAGLNSHRRDSPARSVGRFDRTLRNSRSRTSSGPEGSSDKGCRPCRGSTPIICAVDRSSQEFRRWVHNLFDTNDEVTYLHPACRPNY